jgi:carbonic anhydrase
MMVIMQHTECGIRRLADYPEQLAEFFEVSVDDLDAKALGDPYGAVRIDVDIARRTFPPTLVVAGLVRDVNTGLIEIIVPPTAE